MQGRETLEGERRARKFGVGEWIFGGGYYFEKIMYGLDLLVPGPSYLSCPCFVQHSPLRFCPRHLSNTYPPLLIFAWIFFSRVNSQVCTHAVPLLISKAAPWSVAGALVVLQRAEQQAAGFTCSGRFKEDEAWTAAKMPELSASSWLLLSSLKECADFFFPN